MSLLASKPGKASFRLFEQFETDFTAAFSDRSTTADKRDAFVATLGIDPEKLFVVKQVHGENIVRVTAETESTGSMMADGLMTDCAGVAIGILTADCLPVFFCDPMKRAVGIAHSGWKGAIHGIAPKMVSAFQQNFSSRPENIFVGFGPCIRQTSYEVGSEFESMFPGFYQASKVEGKGYFDLAGYVRKSVIEAGVLSQHIQDTGWCTFKEQDHFYSYRRENQTRERILSVISIRGENNEGK